LEVTGIDANPYMEDFAEKNARISGVPFHFVLGDVGKLPLPDDSFDAIVSTLVLCSVPNPNVALKEACRVLKPGGIFFYWEHVRSPDNNLLRLQQRFLEPAQQLLADGCHLTRETESYIMSSGFQVLSSTRYNFKPLGVIGPHIAGLAERINVEGTKLS